MKTLYNDEGGLYFIKIAMEKEKAVDFLQRLWEHTSPLSIIPSRGDALSEMTDRQKCFRTRWSAYDGVEICTHGWETEDDKNTLDGSVLEFLVQEGIDEWQKRP